MSKKQKLKMPQAVARTGFAADYVPFAWDVRCNDPGETKWRTRRWIEGSFTVWHGSQQVEMCTDLEVAERLLLELQSYVVALRAAHAWRAEGAE